MISLLAEEIVVGLVSATPFVVMYLIYRHQYAHELLLAAYVPLVIAYIICSSACCRRMPNFESMPDLVGDLMMFHLIL